LSGVEYFVPLLFASFGCAAFCLSFAVLGADCAREKTRQKRVLLGLSGVGGLSSLICVSGHPALAPTGDALQWYHLSWLIALGTLGVVVTIKRAVLVPTGRRRPSVEFGWTLIGAVPVTMLTWGALPLWHWVHFGTPVPAYRPLFVPSIIAVPGTLFACAVVGLYFVRSSALFKEGRKDEFGKSPDPPST